VILAPDDPNLAEALLDARFARRYLSEGDSWFSLGGWTGNLLMALDAEDTLIVNCAAPGARLAGVSGFGGDVFAALLAPTDGLPEWDAVLLSGGGNDLLGDCARFVVADPAASIDEAALMDALDGIERHLIRLMRIAQAAQPGVPVFAHTYDHPPVSRRWWWWKAGPWVAPVFRQASIARARWDGLAAMLVDELAVRLYNVAADWPALSVVETRGRLLKSDWRNEIHPNPTGYAEHAIPWRKALKLEAGKAGALAI